MIRGASVLNTVFLLFALNHAATSTAIRFRSAVSYGVGTSPAAVAAGDLNRDGKVDLAVVNHGTDPGSDGGVSILLGNGDGTFQAARNLTAGRNPTCLAVADFNGDDQLDLAVTNGDGNGSVAILLGNGDGTFQTLVDYGSASAALWLVVSDFNHDNRPDVAVLDNSASGISVFLGNGDGTLENRVDYVSVGGGLGFGDFNSDGNPDLVAGTSVLPSNVLLGKGDGTFQAPILIAVSGGSFFGVADLNGDGKLDLVDPSCGIFSGKCAEYLRLGIGDGTFQPPVKLVDAQGGSVAVEDFDGDGNLDVAFNGLNVLPGSGDGTFQAAVHFPITAGGLLFTTDVNSDKAPDLLIVDSVNNAVAVMLNVGTDFTLSAAALTPGSVTAGQSASSTLTLTLFTNFNNPVSLTCSASHPSIHCSVSPSSVAPDGSSSLTVTTTGNSASSLFPSDRFHPGWLFALCLPLGAIVFGRLGFGSGQDRRRNVVAMMLGCVLFVGTIFQVACGGGSEKPCGGCTPAGTYTITITGASGATQHFTTVKLTVQ